MLINTIKLIPINNQNTGVNSSFLMSNLIVINTKYENQKVLMAIRFGIKKELLTPVFWLLIGISFMVLIGILWNVIKGS